MYTDGIKLFAKNEKELDTNRKNKNILSGYKNGIWHRKMCHANNEKQKKKDLKRKFGKNSIAISRKNQNVRRKENLRVFMNIGSGHHQIYGEEGKK